MVENTSKMRFRASKIDQRKAKNTRSNPSFITSFMKKVGEKFGKDKKRMYICMEFITQT